MSVLNRIRPDIRAMSAYHVPNAQGLVKLDAMENPYSLPEAHRQAVAQQLSHAALNRYPVPDYVPLKQALRAYAHIPDSCDVILGNGSDELIAILSQAISTPDVAVRVLCPAPSFVMYKVSGQFNHLEMIELPLDTDDFSLNSTLWQAAIAQYRPAMVYLPYPNNPTGNAFDDTAMHEIIQACALTHTLVVVDEAYQPFAHATWMPQLAQYPHLLVMRTVSKLGLAGVRLGYMAGSPELIGQLDKIRPPYNINILTSTAVCAVLELEREHGFLQAQAQAICAQRTQLCAQLAALPEVQVFETAANFVLIRLSDAHMADTVFARMRDEYGVLVKNMAHAHALLHNCLRITISTPEENAQMLHALRASMT